MVSSATPNLVIIDDQRIFCDSLAMALEASNLAKVSATYTDGDVAIRSIAGLTPDLVLLDLAMPGKPGRMVFEVLRKKHPQLPVIIMSGQVNVEIFAQLWEQGVNGLVRKHENLDSLASAIELVVSGRRYVSDALRQAIGELDVTDTVSLTRREQEVMGAIVDGLANKEIASRLNIGLPTVRTHRENLMGKISARSTAEIIAYALRTGMAFAAETA